MAFNQEDYDRLMAEMGRILAPFDVPREAKMRWAHDFVNNLLDLPRLDPSITLAEWFNGVQIGASPSLEVVGGKKDRPTKRERQRTKRREPV